MDQPDRDLSRHAERHRPPLRHILLSGLGAALAIGATAYLSLLSKEMLLMAPLGSSAALVFAVPWSEFAQPRNVVGGQVVSALVGLLCLHVLGPEPWEMMIALGAAVIAMQLLGVMHPPGGALPLLVMQSGADWWFVLSPVLGGALLIVLIAAIFLPLCGLYRYPQRWY